MTEGRAYSATELFLISQNLNYICILIKTELFLRIIFGDPKIYTNDGFYTDGKEIGGKKFSLNTDGRLDYNFKFESLPSSTFIDSGYEYALAKGFSFSECFK